MIAFLYNTSFGRMILRFLIDPRVSRIAAVFLSSRISVVLIPGFIRKNRIDMRAYIIPRGGYSSFNDFFTRKRIPEKIIRDRAPVISPCDALLTVSRISENSIFHIKHTEYSLRSLLDDPDAAREYIGGTALIFRLTPAHYHRYVYCVTGIMKDSKRIDGVLHSVRPVCHEHTDVFIQNTREYCVIRNSRIGDVVQMEVGALLVGKISNLPSECDEPVYAGDEKGYFEYGGSTIIVLLKKDIRISEKIATRHPTGGEIPIRMGEAVVESI